MTQRLIAIGLVCLALIMPASAGCIRDTIIHVGQTRIVLTAGAYTPGKVPDVPGRLRNTEAVNAQAVAHWHRGDHVLICDNGAIINKTRRSPKVLVLGVIE